MRASTSRSPFGPPSLGWSFLFVLVTGTLLLPGGMPASELDGTIDTVAAALAEELVAFRRDLHRHPETSGEEERTAAKVAERLQSLGLEVETGVGGHGVVALVRGAAEGPVVAYRADMDAVRGVSTSTAEYRSTVEGVAHLCGHDVHTTVGIGVASVLAGLRDRLGGTVKLLFQPAEETLYGAEDMLNDGAFRDPKPDAIFALHSAPLPVGTLACAPGYGLPGMQPFAITFRGADDPKSVSDRILGIVRATSTVTPPQSAEELQRFLDAMAEEDGGFLKRFAFAVAYPTEPEEGDQGRIEGFFRTSGPEAMPHFAVRQQLFQLPEGTKWEMTFGEAFPAMVNDADLTATACRSLARRFGADAVRTFHASFPFNGEDFALFQERVPGTMFWLGVANSEKGIVGMPHAPDFDADEAALVFGTRAMAGVLVDFLESADDP